MGKSGSGLVGNDIIKKLEEELKESESYSSGELMEEMSEMNEVFRKDDELLLDHLLNDSKFHREEAVSLVTPEKNPNNTDKKMSTKKAIVVAALCTFFATINGTIYLPVLAEIQSEFKCSDLEVTLSIVSFSLMTGISPLFHGQLSDHFGRKVCLIANFLCYFGSNLMVASSINIYITIISRGLLGIFSSSFTTIVTSIITDVTPPHSRASAISNSMLISSIGSLLGGPIAGLLSDLIGWRSVFFILCIMMIPVIIFLITMVPETLSRPPSDISPRFRLKIFKPFRLILGNLKLAFVVIPNALTFALVYIVNSQAPLLLSEFYTFSSFEVGLLLMTSSVGSVLGSVFSGKIVEFSRKKKGRGGGLVVAELSSMLVGICCVTFGYVIPFSAVCFVLLVGSGFGMMTSRGVVFSYAPEDNRRETATIVSGLVCVQFLIVSFGLVVASVLLAHVSAGNVFLMFVSLLFLSILPSITVIKKEWNNKV